MTRSPSRARRGFTLVEVLISMVLIAIMGTVLTKLVVTQSRASSRQVLQRNARAVSRGALAIMESELRAVEQSSAFVGGNALTSAGISVPAPTATAFVVNVPWAVGVRCTATKLAILPIDSISQVIGMANNNGVAYRGNDGRYVINPLLTINTSVGATDYSACNNAGINVTMGDAMPQMRVVTLNGTTGLTGGTLGTPVMLYYRVKYEFKASTSVPGRTGLFRTVASATTATFGTGEELVAPFDATSGFAYYVGSNRMPSAPPIANVETITGVQLNLFGQSELKSQGNGSFESSNFTTSIFFRNRVGT